MINPKIDNMYLTNNNKVMRVSFISIEKKGYYITMTCISTGKKYLYDIDGEAYVVLGNYSEASLKIVLRINKETHPEYFL